MSDTRHWLAPTVEKAQPPWAISSSALTRLGDKKQEQLAENAAEKALAP
jgi:hypothetical protein